MYPENKRDLDALESIITFSPGIIDGFGRHAETMELLHVSLKIMPESEAATNKFVDRICSEWAEYVGS